MGSNKVNTVRSVMMEILTRGMDVESNVELKLDITALNNLNPLNAL